MKIQLIEGGVCAAKGFNANGVHCGIRKNKKKKDFSLIVAEKECATACVYTTNLVKGAPLLVTKNHIADGYAQAMICNSGNANTCNANGLEIAEQMSTLLANELKISAEDVVVASTGVIGQPLDITPIANGIPSLVAGLGYDNGALAAEAPAAAGKGEVHAAGLQRRPQARARGEGDGFLGVAAPHRELSHGPRPERGSIRRR